MLQSFKMNSKVLINCLIFGLLYLILCILTEHLDSEFIFGFFLIFMPYLPGVTFPISTTAYKKIKVSKIYMIIHFVLSVLIYFGACRLLVRGDFYLSPAIAGFAGSFLYLISSKFILRLELKWIEILLVSLISGICFLPLIFWGDSAGFITVGFAILTWTLANGILLDRVQK